MRRQGLDRERPRHPHLLLVLVRLVVEQLEVGVPRDRLVDLLPAHPLLDVRVVRDRLQRDVRHPLVDEPTPNVVRRSARSAAAVAVQLRLLRSPLRRVGEQVVREPGTHEPLPRERQRDARGVDRDPPPPPLLGDERRRAGSTGRVKDEVARDRCTSACSARRPSCSSGRRRSCRR